MMVKYGIEKAVDICVDELKAISKPIQGKQSIAQVASISAANEKCGELISEAWKKWAMTASSPWKKAKR